MSHLINDRKKWKSLLLVLISPIIVAISNVLILTIFNLGIYGGTFLRYLYHIVVR